MNECLRAAQCKNKKMHIDCMLVALVLSTPWAAHASTGEEVFAMSLEALSRLEVSIATGTLKSLQKAPAGTSVITAKDLETLASQDLAEALEAVPGMHVSHGDPFLYAPRYFIRGIASTHNAQTLVLVNGLPMTSLLFGTRPGLNHGLPVKVVEMVERIEIIRGPGSAVYGADAFAGVINILTKKPDSVQGGRVSLSHGSFDSTRASLLQSDSLGPVQAALSLVYARSDGAVPRIMADAQTGIDALGLAAPASLAPGPVSLGAKDFEVRLDLAWGDFLMHTSFGRVWDKGTAQGTAEALDPQGRWADHRGAVDLAWSPSSSGDWGLEGRLSYLYTSSFTTRTNVLFPPGANFGAGSFPEGVLNELEIREENARLDLAAVHQGWSGHRLRLGGGFYWGDLFQIKERRNSDASSGILVPLPGGLTDVSDTPGVFLGEAQRTSYYGFVQDEWAFAEDWELTAGLRYDHYSDVGNTTNPRVALVWSTTHWLTSKLLYGEAFRAPAFVELYGTNNPIALGNPELAPERLRSAELAFSLTPLAAAWAWDINLYQLRIRDFIDFVQDPSATSFTAQNAGRVRGRGLETEVRYQLPIPVQLLANYSYQHTEDERSGQPLGLAPRDKVFLRTIWSVKPQWQLTPQLTWIGKRQRLGGDVRADLDGYTTLDVTLRRVKLREHFALALIGRNLFDVDVREPSRGPGPGQATPTIPNDLPQAGRSVMLEASARW